MVSPAFAYALGWILMIAAMMLPMTLALLAIFRRVIGNWPDAGMLISAVVAGYALAWLAFDVAAYGSTSPCAKRRRHRVGC